MMSVELRWLSEDEAASKLGLRKSELKKMRAGLALGDDYTEDSAGRVIYHPAAIARLGGAPVSSGSLSEIARDRKNLVVVRIVPNPNIVVCIVEKKPGETVRCRVKSSKNLRPGSVLAGCYQLSGDLWSFEGRLPRKGFSL